MKIIVDADACPKRALQLCRQWGRIYGVPVWTVASFNHNIESDHHLIVGDASQEADMKVLNITEKGDIVITQDWGLAAMVLGKQASCLSPGGREYSSENIEFFLEERELKAKLRRSGGNTKGPRKRTNDDNRKFEVALQALLEKKKNKNHPDGTSNC